jgi:double-strand break repair protein MRE11
LDFVVWGHEHECRVDPEEVAGVNFQISQPGSSVATSLIEGEAKKKHVLLMEIRVRDHLELLPSSFPISWCFVPELAAGLLT